jgi:hypothetical protein
VAKLVDALDLGSSAARCGGSSPLLGTTATSNSLRLIMLNHAAVFLFEWRDFVAGLAPSFAIASRLLSSTRCA